MDRFVSANSLNSTSEEFHTRKKSCLAVCSSPTQNICSPIAELYRFRICKTANTVTVKVRGVLGPKWSISCCWNFLSHTHMPWRQLGTINFIQKSEHKKLWMHVCLRVITTVIISIRQYFPGLCPNFDFLAKLFLHHLFQNDPHRWLAY